MNKNEFLYFLCGKLLGDGCIMKQIGRKSRFQFMHRTEDAGWAWYGYEQLKTGIPVNPPVYRKVTDSRLKKGFSESVVVQSKTDDIITQLYEFWYPGGKKQLPFDWLELYLDERALAWWYQDDGHLKIVNGIASKIILSTDSFSLEENEWLIHFLWTKWKMKFLRDGQNRLILYDQFQIMYFLHLVSPWMHKSMGRKTLPQQPIKPIAKRTTVYLPTTYSLTKPTAEINEKLYNLLSLINDQEQMTVCKNNIYQVFIPILAASLPTVGYQVIIEDHHKITMKKIRQQTGLTISQMVSYCFYVGESAKYEIDESK